MATASYTKTRRRESGIHLFIRDHAATTVIPTTKKPMTTLMFTTNTEEDTGAGTDIRNASTPMSTVALIVV